MYRAFEAAFVKPKQREEYISLILPQLAIKGTPNAFKEFIQAIGPEQELTDDFATHYASNCYNYIVKAIDQKAFDILPLMFRAFKAAFATPEGQKENYIPKILHKLAKQGNFDALKSFIELITPEPKLYLSTPAGSEPLLLTILKNEKNSQQEALDKINFIHEQLRQAQALDVFEILWNSTTIQEYNTAAGKLDGDCPGGAAISPLLSKLIALNSAAIAQERIGGAAALEPPPSYQGPAPSAPLLVVLPPAPSAPPLEMPVQVQVLGQRQPADAPPMRALLAMMQASINQEEMRREEDQAEIQTLSAANEQLQMANRQLQQENRDLQQRLAGSQHENLALREHLERERQAFYKTLDNEREMAGVRIAEASVTARLLRCERDHALEGRDAAQAARMEKEIAEAKAQREKEAAQAELQAARLEIEELRRELAAARAKSPAPPVASIFFPSVPTGELRAKQQEQEQLQPATPQAATL